MTTSIKFSELRNLPGMTVEEAALFKAHKDTDFSECPELTGAEWRTARPLYAAEKRGAYKDTACGYAASRSPAYGD